MHTVVPSVSAAFRLAALAFYRFGAALNVYIYIYCV